MISFLQKKSARPTLNVDVAATRMRTRLNEVVSALQALEVEPGSLERCLEKLGAENPWRDRANIAELTELSARLSFAVHLLTGFMGEHDLIAAVGDYSIAATQKGLLPMVSDEVEAIAAREEERRAAL